MKIISGGQTGADRGALDAALEMGMECGGWCPKGRIAEDGRISDKYPLVETDSSNYVRRTRMNVCDSDATLIVLTGPGRPTGGTALTISIAMEMCKPCLVVRTDRENEIEKTTKWLKDHNVKVLNVAGPRESKLTGITSATQEFMKKCISFM